MLRYRAQKWSQRFMPKTGNQVLENETRLKSHKSSSQSDRDNISDLQRVLRAIRAK